MLEPERTESLLDLLRELAVEVYDETLEELAVIKDAITVVFPRITTDTPKQ